MFSYMDLSFNLFYSTNRMLSGLASVDLSSSQTPRHGWMQPWTLRFQTAQNAAKTFRVVLC